MDCIRPENLEIGGIGFSVYVVCFGYSWTRKLRIGTRQLLLVQSSYSRFQKLWKTNFVGQNVFWEKLVG